MIALLLFITILSIGAVLTFRYIVENKRAKLKAAFGPQLRSEFSEFADELPDEVATTILDTAIFYGEQKLDMRERIDKKKTSPIETANSAEITVLERTFAQLESDEEKHLLEVCPPRFGKYLSTVAKDEFESRMKRVMDAAALAAQ